MAIQVADNFSYKGKKGNFDRDYFATLADMKSYAETDIDEGHISYCNETDNHYEFKSSNTIDENTGKWRIYKTGTSLTDSEDITINGEKALFADKTYDASNFSGLGRVYLRNNIQNGKNILTQDMINSENTIYHIQYDYDLNSETIIIPNNCTLQFDGGSFNNGTISFNNTTIENKNMNSIFNNSIINGVITNNVIYVKWFANNLSNINNIIQSNTTYIFDSEYTYDISNQIQTINESTEYAIFNIINKENIIFDCNNAKFIYNHTDINVYKNGGIFYINSCSNITIKNIICDGNFNPLDKEENNNRIFICRNIGNSENIVIDNFNIIHFTGTIYSGTYLTSENSSNIKYQGYINNLTVNGYAEYVKYVIAVEGCYNLISNIKVINAHRPCYLGAVDTALINIICRETTTQTFCLLTDTLFVDENKNKQYSHCRNIDINLKIDGIPTKEYNSYARNGILIQLYDVHIDRPIDYLIDNIKIKYYIPKESKVEDIKYIALVYNDNITNNNHCDILQNCDVNIICDNDSKCAPVTIQNYHSQLFNLNIHDCVCNYNWENLDDYNGISVKVVNTITKPSTIIIDNCYGSVYCVQTGDIINDLSTNVIIRNSIIEQLFRNGKQDTTKYQIINSRIKNITYDSYYTEYINIIPNSIEDITKINYLSEKDAGRSIFNKSINNPVWWDGSNWVSMRIIEPDTNNYIDCGTY